MQRAAGTQARLRAPSLWLGSAAHASCQYLVHVTRPPLLLAPLGMGARHLRQARGPCRRQGRTWSQPFVIACHVSEGLVVRPRRLGRRGPRDPTVAMRQWWHSLSRFLLPSVASACTWSCGSACSAARSCPGSRIGSLPGHTANVDRRAVETLSGRQVRMATMANSIPAQWPPFHLGVLPFGFRLQFVGGSC